MPRQTFQAGGIIKDPSYGRGSFLDDDEKDTRKGRHKYTGSPLITWFLCVVTILDPPYCDISWWQW